jgi:hypothetical protein
MSTADQSLDVLRQAVQAALTAVLAESSESSAEHGPDDTSVRHARHYLEQALRATQLIGDHLGEGVSADLVIDALRHAEQHLHAGDAHRARSPLIAAHSLLIADHTRLARSASTDG